MTSVALGFYSTSIGKKVVMAATGVLVIGFVVGHMVGNLQLFLGREQYNAYAAFLKNAPALVWTTRLTMLAAIGLHILAAAQLTLQSWAARPEKYRFRQRILESDYAARTMRWTGPLLATYVVYHLLHFTTGQAHPTFDVKDVYGNVVSAFSNPVVAGVYVVSMLALGFHLFHGLWSLLQTVGANHPVLNPWRRRLAVVITVALVGGYISLPVAVFTGVIR